MSNGTAPSAGVPVCVGRQGIFDADGGLHAYELLFRLAPDADAATVAPVDADRATTAVMLAAFADFGTEALLGGRPGFVNLSRSFVTGALPVPFPPEVAVLEVLESLEVDEELLAGVAALREQGYRIALDDYALTSATAPLLQHAQYVKVDVLATLDDELERVARAAQEHGAVLLAEKVEDAQTYARCRSLGFTLFQGYHLARPQTMTASTLSPAHVAAVRLFTALSDASVDLAEVEALVGQDPALVYKVLRMANSAGGGASRSIGSLREALVRVGLAQLRAWVMLLTVAGVAGDDDGRLETTVSRARSCQNLARHVRGADPGIAFTLGILTGVATLLGLPDTALLKEVGPGSRLAAGLSGEPTPERQVLEMVLGLERQDLRPARRLGVPLHLLPGASLDALRWSHQTLSGLAAA